MPRFQNERTIQRRLWKSMIFMTIIVCSIFLYSSFIYQGRNKLSNEAYSQTVSSVLAQSQCPEKCLTKECIQNANYFLGSINPDVNPCDNFYSFACGSYIQKVGKSENHSVISDMKLSMKNTIADMLQNVNGSANSSAEKMKTVFESCMSFTASEINAMQTISEFLNRLGLGDWPHLSDDFYFNSPTLEETLAILEAHDEYAFLIFQAQRKSESPDSLSLLHVSVKGNSESNSSYIDGYEDIVKKTLRYHKMNENKISEEWESFKTIEKDIYDASLANKLFFDVYGVEDKNASTTESTVNDTTASQIAVNKVKEAEKNLTDYGRNYEPKLWGCAETESDNVTFICNILKFFITHTGLENEFTKKFVLVQEADEVFGLYSILKNYTHRSIANFLALRFFIRHMKEMNVYFRSMKYHVIKDGSLGYSHFFARHPQNKREHCASWMAVAMSEPLALLYISDIMPLELREDINDMFKNFLIKAGNYTVEQEWIDNSTKRAFHELFRSIELNPYEKLLSNFSQFMLKFEPSKDNFFWNISEYQKVKLKHTLSSNFYRFNDDSMFVVNAVFGRHIVLRYGILNPPAYHFNRPSVLNLGSVGYIILHEIGHGISMVLDAMMHKGDANATKYKEKSACLQDQFSEYVLEKIGKNVKGKETFSENVADLISVQIIDKMLEELISENDAILKKSLPALRYSMQQLVFISMAQLLCESRSRQLEEEKYRNDNHAPTYIRLNGMVRNSKTFGNIFNCKPGSNMNPIEKCIFLE